MSDAYVPDQPETGEWDAVVIGTGMGGATAGYELARAGHRVLFIEKGPFLHANYQAALTAKLEVSVSPTTASADVGEDESSSRLSRGAWPHRAFASTNFGDMDFYLPVGCMSGGSTAFYAAGLERFAPSDFTPRANFPSVKDSDLPDRWPVSYQEMEPYYERAETLYRVSGTQDPLHSGGAARLSTPVQMSPRDRHFEESFRELGLHPYRLHVGCAFVAGCDGCPVGPCPRACKSDSAWISLMPALQNHGARILPECEVLRLDADAGTVRSLRCRRDGQEMTIRARLFVLAAGAFITPVLLLKSVSAAWPAGLANRSGLVGRNLMFHGGDFFALSPRGAFDGTGPQKTLAINDLYQTAGEKLGTFQTLGASLEVGRIMQYLRDSAESSRAWWRWVFWPRPVWWRKLTSPIVRAVALLLYHLLNFKHAAIWVSIIEDLPYRSNRVRPDPEDPDRILIEYRYSDELKRRVLLFRKLLRKALGPHRMLTLSTANKIDYPHVCGTCRFGNDPSDSVLDRDNRAHGIENLFVVDASFFPSSGGTNPSLTIAANALRVAGVMDQQLRAK